MTPVSLSYLDFLKFDQLLCEGETPESIEANLRKSVEQRAEDLFNAVDSNLSQVKSITNQWLKEAENLPPLGSSQEENIKALERTIFEIRLQKQNLDKTFNLVKNKLEEQKKLRADLFKALDNYQISLENTPSRDPRETALIEEGRTFCKYLNTRYS